MTELGNSSLEVFPFCLGGNTFGWTTDQGESFAVLDVFVDAQGNFIDTADVYSVWVDGHSGGESERVLGAWMSARGNREAIVLATKVGSDGGLGADNIRRRVEASMERLQTDYIDLLYAHRDDKETPLEETLTAFGELVRAGTVRHIAASNYSASRWREALDVSAREGLPRFEALQAHYNLIERERYENELAELCAAENVACLPYYALASGFLTGKYRRGQASDTRRGRLSGERYLRDDRAVALLDDLDAIANARGVPVAAVSLAWLMAQPTVAAPVAGARTPGQLSELLRCTTITLTEQEVARLSVA